MSSLSFVIPTYNGADLLRKYLPGILDCAGESEVIVVDDAGGDDTPTMLCSEFPTIKIIRRDTNGGFSAAVNDGIHAASGDFILLLNNDVEAPPDLTERMLPLFDDESVFAVCPRTILPAKGNIDEGAKTGFWHHGMFYSDQLSDVNDVTSVLYTSGCAAIYRRPMLDALGGFEHAYSPFYWEDADLGYRAWKRGWRSLYQPAAAVYHQHSASTSRIKASFTSKIKTRNSLFFIWRNIECGRLTTTHRKYLPLVLLKKAVEGDTAFLRGWREAYARRHEAIRARDEDSRHRKLSDEEIFTLLNIKMG